MEADSGSGRRGRPRVFPEDAYDSVSAVAGGPLTRRQRQNRLYANKALDHIDERYGDDERTAYLLGGRSPRWGVLAELGRTLDVVEGTEREGEVWEMMTWLLREQPRAKDAEAEIRRFRTGREPPAQTDHLADELARTLDSYRSRHPALSRAQEIAALRALLAAVERSARAEESAASEVDPGRR